MRLAVLLTALAATVFPAVAVAAPSASYTTAPAGPSWYTGEPVTFTSTGSCDAAPCTYVWVDDGGDGPGGTQWPLGTGPVHARTFLNPGTKNVRLTVTNAAGQSATTVRAHQFLAGPRPGPGPGPGPDPGGSWPNLLNTGARGTLTAQSSSSITASTAGQVIQNLRLTGGASIRVNANNVVIRNVRLEGGTVTWSGNRNVLLEDVTVTSRAGTTRTADREGVIGYGGGTLRRVQVTNRSEGIRDGDSAPLHIADSYVHVNGPPSGTSVCSDWHGDGFQGYGGGSGGSVRNTFLFLDEDQCGGGTAPFFWPDNQGNGTETVDRVIVRGGGYSFRMGTPGSVTNLKIVNGEWGYGPISVDCNALSAWSAARVTLSSSNQPTDVASQPCNTNDPDG